MLKTVRGEVVKLSVAVQFVGGGLGVFVGRGWAAVAGIPDVVGLAGRAALAEQLREETAAVDFERGREFGAGDVAERREEIHAGDQVGVDAAGGNFRGPARDQGHMVAAHGAGAFAAGVVGAFEARGHGRVRAVVAGEEDEGVFAQAEFLELGDEATDHLVHVSDHVGEVLHVALGQFAGRRRVPFRAVGRRLKRVVREDHRVVEEKRPLAVAGDEIEREVADEFRAVFAFRVVDLLAVEFEAGIRVARGATGLLPEKRFVEAEVLRQAFGFVQLQLPLAGDAGGVTGRF